MVTRQALWHPRCDGAVRRCAGEHAAQITALMAPRASGIAGMDTNACDPINFDRGSCQVQHHHSRPQRHRQTKPARARGAARPVDGRRRSPHRPAARRCCSAFATALWPWMMSTCANRHAKPCGSRLICRPPRPLTCRPERHQPMAGMVGAPQHHSWSGSGVGKLLRWAPLYRPL